VRSFLDVFPYVSLWSTELHEAMLVGSLQPIELDPARIKARFDRPETSSALHAVGIASPAALLATWMTGREGLSRYAADVPAVTDDRPRIEYATWLRPGEFSRTFNNLNRQQSDPPLQGADSEFAASLADARRELASFYRMALSVYARDRAGYAREAENLGQAVTENPYYRWFLGSRDRS